MKQKIRGSYSYFIFILVILSALCFINLKSTNIFAEENPISVNSSSTSMFLFTPTSNTECNVRLLEKSVETAIVPSVVRIDEQNYTVTAIAGSGFSGATNLKKVRLPLTVTEIGSNAFANCSQLVSITFPGVTLINTNAFSNCVNLGYIIIPISVQKVGPTILRNTSTKVYVRASEAKTKELGWASNWNGNNSNGEVEYNSNYTPELQYVKISDVAPQSKISTFGLQQGGYYVDAYQPFAEPDVAIPNVFIPAIHEGEPVVGMLEGAFQNNFVNNVTIGYSEQPIHLDSYSFSFLQAESVYINRNVNLDVITWDGKNSIAEFLFDNASVKKIVLPNTITAIGSYMFNECSNLTDIQFVAPTKILNDDISNSIEKSLINNITSTKKIELPASLHTIGEEAFSGLNLINELKIPKTVQTVGDRILVGWGLKNTNQIVKVFYDSESNLPVSWSKGWKSGCVEAVIQFQGVYTIDYNLDGGFHRGNPSSYTSADAIKLNDAEKEGYTFEGWYKDNLFRERIERIQRGSSGNLTLYAKFRPNKYSIIYNPNKPELASNEVIGETLKTNHVYDVISNLAYSGFSLIGWNLIGWNTKSDGSGDSFSEGQSIENKTRDDNTEIVFYAQWQQNRYTVKFNGNRPNEASNPVNGSMLEQEFYYDQVQALSENLFTLKGWQYIGWVDDSTGEGKKYTNKEEISNLTDQNNVVINLYVDWSNNEYLITYDSNRPKSISETLSGSMENSKHHYDISSALNSNNYEFPYPAIYSVIGWSTSQKSLKDSIKDQQADVEFPLNSNVKTLCETAGGTITLYAVWGYTKFDVIIKNAYDGSQRVLRKYTYIDEVRINDESFEGIYVSYDKHLIPKFSLGDQIITQTIRNAHYTISVTSRAFVAGQTATTPLSFSKVYNAVYDEDVVITAPEITNYTFKYFRYLVPLSDLPIGTINPPPPVDYYDNPLTLRNVKKKEGEDYPLVAFYEKKATIDQGGGGNCVTTGTLITLADGRQIPVESLTGNESLLVWNLKKGLYDSAPILFIDSEPEALYDVIHLYFSDGTEVKVISEHAFWDINLNKYVTQAKA